MDKNKLLAARNAAKRGVKSKAPLPNSTSLYALGSNSGTTGSLSSGGSGSSASASSTSSCGVNLGGKVVKRENNPLPTPMVKKLKLLQNKSGSGVSTGVGHNLSGSSASTSILSNIGPNGASAQGFYDHWEEKAIEIDCSELVHAISDALANHKLQLAHAYLCGAVKQLKRAKDTHLYQTLGILAAQKPNVFVNDMVAEAFCSLLRKEAVSKMRGNATAALLAANLLYTTYYDEPNWPAAFVKVYIEDSLAERAWVDSDQCKLFVDNVITAFNTKQPSKSLLNAELLAAATTGVMSNANSTSGMGLATLNANKLDSPISSSPIHGSISNEDSLEQMGSPFAMFYSEIKERLDEQQGVRPRYTQSQQLITEHVVNTLNDQLNRRHMPPEVNRNLVKLLCNVAGISQLRTQCANRLDIWLQNPKLCRVAQDLLLSVCINCTEHDFELICVLVKMRLKTKPLVNHFIFAIRELITSSETCLPVVLRAAIQNELSSTRSRNNMQLIAMLFQVKGEQTTAHFADLIKDLLIKDDCLKQLRALLREVVRSMRHEHLNLPAFAAALCEESEKYNDVDPHDFVVKARLFTSQADLLAVCMFLCVSPTIKESLSGNKLERKELLKQFQFQVAEIQRISVKWLHLTVRKLFMPERNDFIHCLNKVLLLESAEQYFKLDNWPPETDRNFIFRLTMDVPLLEETLTRLLNMGFSKEHYVQPTEVIEIADSLIRRAASLYDGDQPYSLIIRNENTLKLLLKSASYRSPENIILPNNYEPPCMAISDWYWKVWIQILIITGHNASSLGAIAIRSYPTLSLMIEMVITNHFEFPPPSRTHEDLKANEAQAQFTEKQLILQFETHLAAASTKMQINESNSLLLSKLITYDPTGIARKPPVLVMEQLKALNSSLRLGHLLCQSRNPDFLLDIIQRQQKQASISQNNNQGPTSMPWLNELVEMNTDNFAILPAQCLCEFVLGQFNEEDMLSLTSVNNNNVTSLNNHNLVSSNGIGNTNSVGLNGNSVTPINLNAHEKLKRKEKRKKFFKLIAHFQSVLKSPGQGAEELVEYFMKRLSFPQASYRQIVVKALSLILTCNAQLEEDLNSTPEVLSKVWLLEKLSSIENFGQIQQLACTALKDAILVEAIPENVCSYIQFLALYTNTPDQALILNMSRLLIERPIMTKCLTQNDTFKEDFLSSCSKLYYKYLNKLTEVQPQYNDSELANLDNKEYIVIKWTERQQQTIINIRIAHAMILLLTFGPTKDEHLLYQDLLDIWFSPAPLAYSLDGTTQIAYFVPDWLKLRLIRSNIPALVDFALQDLQVSQLLLFIQTFGIPIVSMEKLLSALDATCKKDPETVRASIANINFMKQLIEVQFLRGVKSGYRFAELIGVN